MESVLDALEADKRRNVEGQMGFFDTPGSSQAGEPPLDKAEDFSAVDKLNMEKEVTGMYLSGHPMSAYAGLYQEGGYARMDEILQSAGEEGGRYQDGQWVTVLGLVTAVRKKATKSSSQMAFVTLEDMYGALTALVFSRPLEQYGSLLYEGSVVEVSGKLSFTEEKEPELVCQSMAKPAEPCGWSRKATPATARPCSISPSSTGAPPSCTSPSGTRANCCVPRPNTWWI